MSAFDPTASGNGVAATLDLETWTAQVDRQVRSLLDLDADDMIGDLFDAGLDSLSGLELLAWLHGASGVALDLEELFDHASVAEVAQISHARSARADPTV